MQLFRSSWVRMATLGSVLAVLATGALADYRSYRGDRFGSYRSSYRSCDRNYSYSRYNTYYGGPDRYSGYRVYRPYRSIRYYDDCGYRPIRRRSPSFAVVIRF